jgi:NAD(P)-dependent dehydrogenase (short-subunit alcohol dehydrogenase family)
VPVALITGAGRGIGAATAVRLASDGWYIAVNFRSRRHQAEAVVERCNSAGVLAEAFACDVSNPEQVAAMFASVDDTLGPISVLVNSAGITMPISRLDDTSVATVDELLAVNVKGTFLCTREAVQRMSTANKGAGGVIVNISSIASRLGSPGEYVMYSASKGAIDSLTLGLSKEVAEEGIRVNAVRPGIVRTDIHESSGDPNRADRMAPFIPMKRAGNPEEIANLVAWLCSTEASHVTGALIDASGGR